MLSLIGECHFWTMRDDVRIRSTDLGAFRYARSRDIAHHDVYAQAKRDYTERRNGVAIVKNNRKPGGRHKDNMKKLEELLRTQRIVYRQWRDANVVLMLFSSGLIAHICVDTCTGDIHRMVFEKYFVGKLAAEVLTDAFFTRSHIVLAYNTNQLTVVYLQKPSTRLQGPEKIANMDPKIFHVLIPGPGDRKLARNLMVNSSSDLFIIWTMSSQNEVYPWRPTIRDQDRANIHVFKLKGLQLESLSYCWSENDPLHVDFLHSAEGQILTVEQKISRKGESSVEICSYEINTGKMPRTTLTSIPMGAQICCYTFSPDQEKLFLGSIDRRACLYDIVQNSITSTAQIDIIPNHCSWHSDSSMMIIGNDRSQLQCFDLALNVIASQLQSEDIIPSIILDLAPYLRAPTKLLSIAFGRKCDLANFAHGYAQTDSFLLLHYEGGPLGCLRFFASAGMKGDIHNSGLTADVIIDKYLSVHQLEKAVNLLLTLNWETYGAMCLISLHKIANYVFFRNDMKRCRIDLMVKAIKTFSDSLSEETKDEFSDQVFNLKRRFFFFLLRNNLYMDAFEVAQDIEDYDLFMDLFNTTKSNAEAENVAIASFNQAVVILQEERGNGNASIMEDQGSESSSSKSSSSDITIMHHNTNGSRYNDDKSRAKITTTTTTSTGKKNYVPALPSMKTSVLNAEMIKINIPKPELRMSASKERLEPPLYRDGFTAFRNQNHSEEKSTFNSPLTWHDIPDQTVGIPTILNALTHPYIPSTAHNILPRASTLAPTTLNPALCNVNHQQKQNHKLPSHFAAPVIANPFYELRGQNTLSKHYPAAPVMNYQPKFYQHPLVSGTIPPTSHSLPSPCSAMEIDGQKCLQKKPAASILSNGMSGHNGYSMNIGHNVGLPAINTAAREAGGKSTPGERNKVKFSDTVQVAVVPEIPRKEKVIPKKNGYSRPAARNLTNPKKELADSLPLCHPNDEYLKDFNPLSTEIPLPSSKTLEKESNKSTSKSNKHSPPPPPPSIKVVHFGVV